MFKTHKTYLLVLFTLGLVVRGWCGYSYFFDSNSRLAIDNIAAFKFDLAREQLTIAKRLNPTNNIPYWAVNYIDFLELMNEEREDKFEELLPFRAERLERLSKGMENSPYKQFCQAEVLMQWAFVRIKFRQYVTAFKEIDRAYTLLDDNSKRYPDFVPNKAGMGVLHILIGSVPDNYAWITKLVGYKGTVEQGLAELNAALYSANQHADYKFLETECSFFLAFLYLNLESNRDKALKFRDDYLASRKMGLRGLEPIQAYALGKLSLQLGLNDDANEILMYCKSGEGRSELRYLDYLRGQTYLNKLSDSSRLFFQRYITKFKGRNFIKSAYQRIAWSYLIEGDTNQYLAYIRKVPLVGVQDTDSDKQAQREATKSEIPNPMLLKSRFLSDGGYYQRALKELEAMLANQQQRCIRDEVELHYRKARVLDDSGNKKQALLWYRKTILLGDKLPYYFAANAALKSGAIHESQNDPESAAKNYRACLKMDYEEYKNGISQKAKIALQRVTNQMKKHKQ